MRRHKNPALTASGDICFGTPIDGRDDELSALGRDRNVGCSNIGSDHGHSDGGRPGKYRSNSPRKLRSGSACLSHAIDAGVRLCSSECVYRHCHNGRRSSYCVGEVDVIGRLSQDLNTR